WRRGRLADGPGRLDGVEPRQAVVHQHDVGTKLRGSRLGLRPVGHRGDDGHVGTKAEQELQRVPEHVVVLHEDDADRLVHVTTVTGYSADTSSRRARLDGLLDPAGLEAARA